MSTLHRRGDSNSLSTIEKAPTILNLESKLLRLPSAAARTGRARAGKRAAVCVGFAFALILLLAPSAWADFGFDPGSLSAVARNKDGTIDNQAGSHPYDYTVSFKLKTDGSGNTEGGETRDIVVDLPPGFTGNPLAVPRCPRALFEGITPQCPASTQVGIIRIETPALPGFKASGPIYNLVAPPGVAGQIGFSAVSKNALQNVSVRSSEGYGLRATVNGIPLPLSSVSVAIWGVPADSGHDPERGVLAAEGISTVPISTDAPVLPFLTLPASCEAPSEITARADSKLAPGIFVSESALSLDGSGHPAPLGGCDSVPFSPQASTSPTTKLGLNPTGLDYELKLPDQGLLSPNAIAETEPRKAVVTLPEGMTVNPSVAEGVDVCTPAQYAAESAESLPGEGCPQASKLGTILASTPLVEEPIEGSLYLAAPYDNPFDSLTALYLVARAPQRGVVIKQAGNIALNPQTGQLTTTFENLPPIPYSSFKLHFREGPRAPLVTPTSCGKYQTISELTPFSSAQPVTLESAMTIERGADGGACPSGGLQPFKPGLIATTLNNAGGRFSPFYARISRTDTEQEITRFSIKLPPGLVGKLAGIPYCSEAAIAAATARTGPHGGAEELASPSCPAASELGHTLAGAGVGQALSYAPGRLYLAGPYRGAGISLVSITSAQVGPVDLGTVVVRLALRVDPETGQVSADSMGPDPIPHIIKGVPDHLREIRTYVDRPQFILNPTNCEPSSTAATLLGSGSNFASGADDNPVVVSARFQASDCASLPFKPMLAFKLKGGTKRGDYPALQATLKAHPGEANLNRVVVALPHSEFLAQEHIRTVCTRVQFAADNCPAASIYGYAKAITPLLDKPLQGPVYLRSSSHPLPDLVAKLNGTFEIDLAGRVDSVNGGIRNTFAVIPDAPVSEFTLNLQGAKKGLLVNSTNLCAKPNRVDVKFTGQNGKLDHIHPPLNNSCPSGGQDKKKKGKAQH